MALPNRPTFRYTERWQPRFRSGIVLRVVPGDHTAPVEIERAPDSGGSPGTYISLGNNFVFPKNGGFHTDFLPNDGLTYW
jgi:hypothetical protein